MMNENIPNQSILKNVYTYKKIGYLNASILFWSLGTLYYVYRGMNFFQIAALQSIGSIMSAILEVPTGWLSDKYGHTTVLKISSIAKICAVFLMIIANNFWVFLISEFFFSLGTAAQSGADTALLFESLKINGKEDEYTDIISKVRSRQSLIRMAVRLIAPVLYTVQPELPFILSAFIYIAIAVFTYRYIPLILRSENVIDKTECHPGNWWHTIQKKVSSIALNKAFIIYSLFSSVLLISVSNYCQYIGPYLEGLGFTIGYLGIVTSFASIGEYIGIKLVRLLKNFHVTTLLVVLSGIIALFVFTSGMRNSLPAAIIAYCGINAIYAPFTILLSNELQKVIPSHRRATMLSISSQLDDIISVLTDPFIGIGIDKLGFGIIYQVVSVITLIFIIIVFIFVKRIMPQKGNK